MRWPWPVAVAWSVLTGALVLAGIVLALVDPTSSTIALCSAGSWSKVAIERERLTSARVGHPTYP